MENELRRIKKRKTDLSFLFYFLGSITIFLFENKFKANNIFHNKLQPRDLRPETLKYVSVKVKSIKVSFNLNKQNWGFYWNYEHKAHLNIDSDPSCSLFKLLILLNVLTTVVMVIHSCSMEDY